MLKLNCKLQYVLIDEFDEVWFFNLTHHKLYGFVHHKDLGMKNLCTAEKVLNRANMVYPQAMFKIKQEERKKKLRILK